MIAPAGAETLIATLDKTHRVRWNAFRAAHGGSADALAHGNPWLLAMQGIVRWDDAEAAGRRIAKHPAVQRARLGAAVREALRRLAMERGHLAYPLAHLGPVVAGVLSETPAAGDLATVALQLIETGLVVHWDGTLALPEAAAIEASAAEAMARHAANTPPVSATTRQVLERRLAKTMLSAEQRAAAVLAATHGFSVITGPAGTGKTVIIKELIGLFEGLGEIVNVGTPTGKAAEVLKSRGVRQADTNHSLLGLKPDDTQPLQPVAVAPQPLRGHWLILDETTQVDAVLWERLWAAIPMGMRVIALGDIAQLPPVGPGAPFEACVRAPETLPVARIEEVRRTSGRLTSNGLAIRGGRLPVFDPNGTTPPLAPWYNLDEIPIRWLVRARELASKRATPEQIRADAIAYWMVDLITCELPRAIPSLRPQYDIQLLAPQAPGPLGTNRLNSLLREVLNPLAQGEQDALWWYAGKTHKARAGDQVIVIDSLSSEIKNGATGEVVRLEAEAKRAIVRFTHRAEPVAVARRDMNCLMLRYALTVHRTQGSEYPVVLQLSAEMHNPALLTRRNLYTGATRARQVSGFVASEATLLAQLANVHGDERHSTLISRYRAALRSLAPPNLAQTGLVDVT